MAQQISQRLIGIQAPPQEHRALKQATVRRLWSAVGIFVCMSAFSSVQAESMASKNNEGNRLFLKGRYAEAEKAYLDAQVKSPGKPEVLYNLGNSLVKQKKFKQGIQALHQSMNSGSKEIKEHGWYNTGNALYSMGNYQDAIQSYIQALKLNSSDKDAKHNLELALMKQKEQNQQRSNPNQKPQNSGNQNPPQTQKKSPDNSNNQGQQSREKQQQTQPKPREGSISKEQAQQILDALQSRELEDQRKLREQRVRQRTNERDW